MGKLLDSLKEYLNNATPEQLEEAWKEVEEFKNVDPTIKEFIENNKKFCSVHPDCNTCYRKDDCLMEETEHAWKEKIEGEE